MRDWLASTDGSAQALERLFIQVEPGLWLLPCGTAQEWPEDRQPQLARVLLDLGCDVVVDAGLITDLGRSLASAGRSLLLGAAPRYFCPGASRRSRSRGRYR